MSNETSITSRERLMNALKEREKHIRLPERGVTIDYFTNTSQKNTIDIHISIQDIYKGGHRLVDGKPKTRKMKIRHKKIDIGKVEGVINGVIPRHVKRNHVSRMEDTIDYINEYLDLSLTKSDINLTSYSENSELIEINILPNSLRYCGKLLVYVIREN